MITLTVYRFIENDLYKANLEVVESSITPRELFLFRKDIDNNDIYCHVCNLTELNTYPTSYEPGVVFMRMGITQLVASSVSDLEELINTTKTFITDLDKDFIKYTTDGLYNTTQTVILNEESI